MSTCHYCGHPDHIGVTPQPISKARAAALQAARGFGQRIQPTAAECETIWTVWDRLPPETTYHDAWTRIRALGSQAVLRELPNPNGLGLRPRTRVTCAYRKPDCIGVVLAFDDPRAWAGTLAFPESNPDPQRVRVHAARCRSLGMLNDGKVPVLWPFEPTPRVYWDSQLTPYDPSESHHPHG